MGPSGTTGATTLGLSTGFTGILLSFGFAFGGGFGKAGGSSGNVEAMPAGAFGDDRLDMFDNVELFLDAGGLASNAGLTSWAGGRVGDKSGTAKLGLGSKREDG
jgi:hypothetical protein